MPAPTRTRVPPRRSWWNPTSMAAFLPEHSSTTWTARSEIRSGSQAGKVSRSAGSRTSSAPRSAASRLRRSPGSTAMIGPMPRATSAAMERAPIGPAPMTMTLSPGATPERVMPWRATASGSASAAWRADRPGGSRSSEASPHQHVAGEGPVVAVDDRTLPVLALRGLALAAPSAPPAPGRRTADHRVADLPTVHPLAERDDRAGELVAGHQTRLVAPPVEQHVDVGAADPAVVHLDQHLARPGPGHRPLLDDHLTGPPVAPQPASTSGSSDMAPPPRMGPSPAGPAAGGSLVPASL